MCDFNEENIGLVDLINLLYEKGGLDNIKEYFEKKLINCITPSIVKKSIFNELCIYLKYYEHCKIFNLKFSRQTRGSIFLFEGTTKKFICVKNLLQRGIEYLTEEHIRKGINENENIDNISIKNVNEKFDSKLDYLDNDQKLVVRTIIKNESIEGWLSFKNDGALMGISLYPRHLNITNSLIDIIYQSDNEFSKLFIKKAVEQNSPFIPIISSSGTLTVNDNMLSYFTTAIFCGIFKGNYEDLVIKIKSDKITAIQIMEKYCIDKLLTDLMLFYNYSPHKVKDNIMSLSFEAIVKDRKCAWGEFHPELAISYDECSCKFLGCTFNIGQTTGIFRSHFQLEYLFSATSWNQPLYWKIVHSNEIENMIKDLSNILINKMTENQYLEKYKPLNRTDPKNFDYEGFVFFSKVVNDNKLDLTDCTNYPINIDCDLNYGKIKTPEYYKCHKLKYENIDFLLSLDGVALKHLPIVKTLKNFYPNLKNYLREIITEIRKLLILSSNNKNHELFESIESKKIKISFLNKDFITKSKMIINCSPEWKNYSFKIFFKYFNVLENDKNTIFILKKIVMEIEPWSDNFQNNIDDSINNTKTSNTIKKFLVLLFGTNL